MIRRQHIVKVNLPGGVVPAGLLLAIAEAAGTGEARFGSRQQLFLEVRPERLADLTRGLLEAGAFFEVDADEHPNIMSSYVAENILPSTGWTRESVYKDILDGFDAPGFDTPPRLKVNLADPGQNLVPIHTGHLNFVASTMGNYWHLLVRFPGTERVWEWPSLVYSENVARLCKVLEAPLLAGAARGGAASFTAAELESLYASIMAAEQWLPQPAPDALVFPEFALPYYEGFNRYAQGLWLGVYRRDERFPLSFLRDASQLALATKVAQFFVTPWKSLVIKGIASADRKGWDSLLGRNLINVRHALNELCWQSEDLSEEGLTLKNFLVRQFDKEDVRTWGLCFAVQVEPGSAPFASVLVRKRPNTSANQRKALDRYDILYARDFNPHDREYILFRKEVEKEHLAPYLISLCKYYYELKSGEVDIAHHAYGERRLEAVEVDLVYQCKHCLTITDPEGPCPVCEAEAVDFIRVPRPVPVG